MALSYRIIARLDVKGKNVIKPVQYEGLRVVGDPATLARKYAQDADELLFMDAVASLYGRNQLEGLLTQASEEVFVPLTVAGGIKDIASASAAFKAGADKIALNTAAIQNHLLVSALANRFGSQAVCVAIECKKTQNGWEAYTDGGRNASGRNAILWAEEAQELGAGEILITSIDRDGTKKGPDLDLLANLQDLEVPLIYSGGVRLKDVKDVASLSDGMAIGASLHFNDCTIAQIKNELRDCVEIR